MGGWITNLKTPNKDQVWWFSVDMIEPHNNWIYEEKEPQLRIAALEMMGTLVLFTELTRKAMASDKGKLDMHFEMATDNYGNDICIVNEKSRKWPNSAILMTLVWEAHTKGAELGVIHKKREYNKWADQLANQDFDGFDNEKRLQVSTQPNCWEMLETMVDLKEAENAQRTGKRKR